MGRYVLVAAQNAQDEVVPSSYCFVLEYSMEEGQGEGARNVPQTDGQQQSG